MGRTNEFKVGKSFTLGMIEVAWLAEQVKKGDKASVVINKLIRQAIAQEQDKKPEVRWCSQCMVPTGRYRDKEEHFFCEKCEKRDYVLEELYKQYKGRTNHLEKMLDEQKLK